MNNQFQNLNFDDFISEFNVLLDKAEQIAGSKEGVFVVSIPDYGVTPFGSASAEEIAVEIDQYNAYISERCSSLNIRFINITEISRDLGDSPDALASDNLHPSGQQYSIWIENILPSVINLLNQ